METKASYVLVGAFTLAVIAIAFGYILWVAGSGDNKAKAVYTINFQGSVSGLSVTSPVLLNGVPVGQVSAIRLSRKDVSAVHVEITVDKDTPIRENSVATLEPQGLTGTSRVMISGDTNDSPLLTASDDDDEPPVIRSETGGLQAIMRTMPQVLSDAHDTLQHVNMFFNEKNRLAVESILANVNSIVASVNARMGVIEATLANLEKSSRELNSLLVALRPAGQDFSSAMNKFEDSMGRIDKVTAAAAPGLEKFSRDGVDDFRRLMIDTRQMVNSINRLTQKIENDPRRFLFGQPMPEYKE